MSAPQQDRTGERDSELQACVRQPMALVDCCPARDVIEQVGRRRYLHAGPQLALREASPAMVGALVGALIFEGEADTPDAAMAIVERGDLELLPCHAAAAVGALAGVVSPGTPMMVVERGDGRRTFSPIHEGAGDSLRAGQFDAATINNLRSLRDGVAPVLADAMRKAESIDPLDVISSGLARGDEAHNRNVASSAELFRRLAPAICEVAPSPTQAATVMRVLANNVQFFLPVAMAAAKAVADDVDALGIEGLVTAVAANGTHLGIRVSGSAGGWFTTPAPIGDVVFYEGFGPEHVGPLAGDSPVVETIGLGAFALSAAPNLARTLGLRLADATRLVDDMRSICVSRADRFRLSTDDFAPTGFGIDARRVVATGVTPAFSIGYLHRELGGGRVGAGLLHAPLQPFVDAVNAAQMAGAAR